MNVNRIAITGSSGYIGRLLVERFKAAGAIVLGIDLNKPTPTSEPYQFVCADVREEGLRKTVRDFDPDSIIHGAFVVKPMRDTRLMSAINVDGTRNIMRIAEELSLRRFMLISSATAYGAWADNPVPMSESQPLRQRDGFQYAVDKVAIEDLLVDFQERNPQLAVSWVRPTVVGGPNIDNFLSRFIFGMPFVAKLDGVDTPSQFVHEEDVVAAVQTIVEQGASGPFNLAPPDRIYMSQVAQETGRRLFSIPFWLAYSAAWLAWTTRFKIHESPPAFLYFVRHPWVISSEKITRELGFKFKYSSLETLRACLAKREAES